MNYDLSSLMKNDGFVCPDCGRRHFGNLKDCVIGRGALSALPSLTKKYGGTHPFVLCDRETYEAAGKAVCAMLEREGIPVSLHVISRTRPAPDEKTVGEAVMYCPPECDLVIAVGGGVINDTCKILSSARHVPDFIVGTAASMDGFASASSSMERSGLKVTLPSKCPDAVIGDSLILSSAPREMTVSGIGDMAAKYVSLVEWQIAHLLLGEYYCPTVAEIVKYALNAVTTAAPDAVRGDPDACAEVMKGLVVSGMAMTYAGLSRPASGMEHYVSHILDMRALEFGTPASLHGIQCGTATLAVIRAYEKLARRVPDREAAFAFVSRFDPEDWFAHLREKLGTGAEAIIRGEQKERKYDPEKHGKRLETILSRWDEIVSLIGTLPSSDSVEEFLRSIGHPVSASEWGVSEEDFAEAFLLAKDVRDKYVLGRLLWDLGITDIVP